ncbi:hypothetical protein OnM2_052013 [Erysiphe neolycopersici]|uniref:Uncharacterized protein n=1 Tax=Erysiphe neolycopersici TaxID=212602 RepID=A0A420HSB6_9PEZI|nr:hypothetical protein OnM2_052013 [Erysiphe neolycopersici]
MNYVLTRDTETEHLRPNSLLPTMTCFVPSLEAGHNFRVSIHSWENPEISFNTLGLRRLPDKVSFEARLFIDGIESGSKKFVKNGPWPTVIENNFLVANELGQFEPLKFPVFHQELLSQSYWSPIDNLGRLRVVISEGFTRESDNLFERVRNIISFSFQHAPLHLLEKSSIAWPNASMWQQPTHVEILKPRDCSPSYTENISDSRSQSSPHILTDTQIPNHQNLVLTPKAPTQDRNVHEDHLTESTNNIFKNWNESTVDLFALEYLQPDSLTHSLSLPVTEFLSGENSLESICESIFAAPVGNNNTQHDENIIKEVDIIAPNKIMLCGFEDHDLAIDENFYPTLDPDMFTIPKSDKMGISEYRTESDTSITCSDSLLTKEKQSFSLALPGSQDAISSENARNPG